MDDRIIDFNELKNKARDKDVDKFESYIYELYYSLSQGQLSMAEMMTKINKYMQENNISQEKFMNIQKEMMKRYGVDMNNIEGQIKNMGIDLNAYGLGSNYEELRKTIGFQEKYKGRLNVSNITKYSIENAKNKIQIILDKENIMILSSGKIDLTDNELNEFLVSYKKVIDDKQLNIDLCENVSEYKY
ncbi:DUF3867 domain-containing protein [Clostridium sp. 'White wine YQ']|uniref:DUF3867 domain-containing protein n=1 Tax=Clostridium sp. 'White wine YQ' TaxID=3027474 RepID=UPI0023660F9F|nr:DUF3867 domain-containing protein [Clostridium sp. 'White wine YQ']MDD7795793.1 DUF3867 domain-containing protein [Clostridium sp. 'White wine YQ']